MDQVRDIVHACKGTGGLPPLAEDFVPPSHYVPVNYNQAKDTG